jgi:hypothetical protein
VSVLTVPRVPGDFKVDAQLGEWAALGPAGPSASTPSFMIVAAGHDSVVVAGRVRDVPARGLWLELATEPPELPPIGAFERGGGISELHCDVDPDSGYAVPFDQSTCHLLLQGYRELVERFDAMFLRQLHLTSNAALSFREGQESSIQGATYAWQTSNTVVTFELALPLSALPRTAGEELSYFFTRLVRAEAATPPANTPAPPRSSLTFAEPIRFGIDSGVLSCVNRTGGNFLQQPRLAYQPGEPNRAFRTSYAGGSGFALELSETPLSAREAVLGTLELRSVQGASPLLAIFNRGELADCQDVGSLLGTVERGRGLHVIAYQEYFDESVGLSGAKFRVLEIEKDGSSIHDASMEEPPIGFAYTDVGEDHAKNLTSFSISGLARDEGGSRQQTLSWRYDARKNQYKLSERKGRFLPDATPE